MRPGRTIAYRFELLDAAGSGGMATVFRARDKTNGQIVAVKVQQGATLSDERFARESAILANLSHPAIVRFIAHGTTREGESYLVMEWIDHVTLTQQLKQGLTVAQSVALAARVADALGAAHDAGIVHRDVKPDNLLIPHGQIDHVKLADFGIARPMTAAEALTRTGLTIGTPGYMAPEQVCGATVDPRSDVFGLGCVLYECLSGAPAFAGQNPLAMMIKILHEEPAPLAGACREAPAALSALVDRMLAKLRDERPTTMRAVGEALRALGPLDDNVRHPARATVGTDATRVGGPHCVVLIGAGTDANSAKHRRECVDRVAARCAARVDELLEGSLVAIIPPREAPAVRAARAARLALEVHAALGGLVAIACGEAAVDGAALELGRAALASALRKAADGVHADDATAALLEATFWIERGADGAIVRGERV